MELVNKIELIDRILWFDGTIEAQNVDQLMKLILHGISFDRLAIGRIDDEVKKFNSLSDDKIGCKKELNVLSRDWKIPEHYKVLDVEKFLYDKMVALNVQDNERCFTRMKNEMVVFKRRGLIDMLRSIIYIVDIFNSRNVVYGVGRGSSCASYVLFLIGIHLVDPIRFNIPFTEFMRD